MWSDALRRKPQNDHRQNGNLQVDGETGVRKAARSARTPKRDPLSDHKKFDVLIACRRKAATCRAVYTTDTVVTMQSPVGHSLLLLAVIVAPLLARAEAQPTFATNILPLLSRYCFDCHNDAKHKGDVVLDKFKTEADLLGEHDRSARIEARATHRLGHAQGEEAELAHVAQHVARLVRTEDIFARYDDEEFAVLCRESHATQATVKHAQSLMLAVLLSRNFYLDSLKAVFAIPC